jgi:quinohemoprotein amine dehydrogenase
LTPPRGVPYPQTSSPTGESILRTITLLVGLLTVAGTSPATAQRDTLPGYRITDPTVIAACGACHTLDSTGRMSRLSFMRKTPEGWETSIRRMVTLNNVQLEPETARRVLHYLANQQGLAPAEVEPGRFEVERRLIEYQYAGNDTTNRTCRACHSLGRVITQRRTGEEWGLVVAMHRGYYPVVEFQGFRGFGDSPRHPMDQAIRHLSSTFPLETPAWTAWKATMRAPRLEGTWTLAGEEPGRGPFHGRLTITRGATDDEFTTEAVYRYIRSGAEVRRSGRSAVYTGHQWRGRSALASAADQPWREVMHVAPDQQSMTGRWFTGGYDEFGMDVTLHRVRNDAVVAAAHPHALQSNRTQEVTFYGDNLPTSLTAAAVDLGPGVRVQRVVRASSSAVTVEVQVDSGAAIGARDLFLAGTPLRSAVLVYDTVSRISVTPRAGMARVGGIRFPKQFQQFEVVAWHNGPDGRASTADDIDLGPVPVTWSLEEYSVTYDDDDLKFVGTIDQTGLFTPNVDGPNPARSGERNNIGDIWVVATYTPPDGRPMRARGHLVVTVPLYMRWEPWRIAP